MYACQFTVSQTCVHVQHPFPPRSEQVRAFAPSSEDLPTQLRAIAKSAYVRASLIRSGSNVHDACAQHTSHTGYQARNRWPACKRTLRTSW